MTQRYNDDYGSQRGREDSRSGGRGGRPEYDDPNEQRGRERQRGGSRHTMYDDDVPDVRFGRNISEGGEFSGGGERDFIDETSQGQHSGYGDYGQQDYRPQTGGQSGQGRGGEGQRFGGQRRFARGDYRGTVGPGGYGYAESNYGPGRGSSPGGGQDWASNQRGGNQDQEEWGATRYRGSQGSQFGSESRYSGRGRSYGGGFQSYRGRGPRGYTRSDERLKEVICEMLTDAEDIDASDIEVTVTEAVVLLDGSVDDRWTKYQAEEMAGQVPGVKDVRNQLRVQPPGSQQGERSSQRTGSSASGTSESSGSGSSGTGTSTGAYGSTESTSGSTGRKGSSGSSTPKTG